MKASITIKRSFISLTPRTFEASSKLKLDVCSNIFSRALHQTPTSALERFEFPWKFGKVPTAYWKQSKNQRKYVNWLSSLLDIKNPEEWYNVTGLDFKKNGAVSLLVEFNGSISKILQSVYPEQKFLPWKFKCSSKGFWRDMKNQRTFFDWLGIQLGLKNWEDWYKVNSSTVHEYGGGGMITPFYGNSMSEALRSIYPEHNWEVWKFARVPKKFWNERNNQMEYVKWLEKVLNIQEKDDWYRVKLSDISELNGNLILQVYGGSLYKFLQSIYPEHNWIPWKLSRNPRDIWNNKSLVRMYLDELSQQLHVTTLDDWYRISAEQLQKLGAGGLIMKHGGLPPLLIACFPEHNWQVSKFWSKAKKSAQRWLRVCVSQLFPNDVIHEDYKHPDMKFQSQESVELDVYIPSLKLAFEYQGEQHYRDIFSFSPQSKYEYRDIQKVQQCQERGITLIVVPYWWDRELPSLAATIQSVRPELPFPLMPGSVIPFHPPPKKSKRSYKVV